MAGLEVGRSGASLVPLAGMYVGLVVMGLAYLLGAWAMAVNEHFEFDVGTLLANFLDLVEGELAGQDDSLYALALPESYCRIIDGIGLHRKMDWHLRPPLFHHHDQARICHDQRIRAQFNHGFQIADEGPDLAVMRHQVCSEVEFLAERVRFPDADLEIFILENII